MRRSAASRGARNSSSTFFTIARNRPQRLLAGRRQTHDLASPVAWIAPPLHEAPVLELVEQADELAAVVAERIGDLPLRLARALVEE